MREYPLHNGGYVKIDWQKDVQSVRPWYENTVITLTNGKEYALKGRNYGV